MRWIKGTYLSEKYILNNCVVHGHEKRINHVTCVVIGKNYRKEKKWTLKMIFNSCSDPNKPYYPPCNIIQTACLVALELKEKTVLLIKFLLKL